jgi:serine/threonine protein phosphatase PrpC
MPGNDLSAKSSSATHVGMVRKLNEDSYISRDDIGLWSVADGMGGHQAGDLASQTVVAALAGVPACNDIHELLDATRLALSQANSKLIGMDGEFSGGRVPGSTVVVLLIVGREAAVVWAGDSRIYRFRNGVAEQITRDHSHVQELVDQHLIRPEEAESHPMANVITRAIGIEEPLETEALMVDVMEGDRFLLCSDGLTRLLNLEEIQNLMTSREMDETTHTMIHTALIRGAPDNVTVVEVQCLAAGEWDDGDDDTTVIRQR